MSSPNRIREIFTAAVEIDSQAERSAYLDRACGSDAECRARVEALLKSHEDAEDFLDKSPIGNGVTLDTGPLTEGPGTVIGRYKLLEQIGEGGMGVVYMAEQTEPVRRRVALKIIKIGMDTRRVIARFEAERQALALMDHPNIARILDAGATETGRPYFVMELVRGIPITEYCDKNHLTGRQRLDLFSQVCGAVQHAHQKGIIHRDIKPTNVMITLHDGKPVPKVIDFGIAKAINQRLTEKTLFTGFAQMVGTPAYMSPEQAEMSGLDVDTRTDIYSLGALLYELLTGVTPFDEERLRSAGYGEIQRIIREEEPVKPSTCVSTLGAEAQKIADRRHTDPASLHKLCRGDLDWIVMKALEKDRTRRYPTATELADEIERYLRHEPVLAGRPGSVYRLRKFARRHRVGVAAGLAVTIALIAGLTLAVLGLREARREAQNAEEAAWRERLARKEQTVARQQAEKAKAEAEDRLRLADRNVRLAWNALEEFYGRVADRWNVRERESRREKDPHGLHEAEDEPRGSDEGDQGLWRRLLRFYESFAKTNSQAPELRPSVEKAYGRVLAARERLAEYFPQAIEHRKALGRASCGLAALLHADGDSDDAKKAYDNAITTQEKLVNSFPAVREYRTDLAASHRGLAVVLKHIGRHQAAEQHRRAAGELDTEPGSTPEAATEWQIAYPDFSDHTDLNLVDDAGVSDKRLRLTLAEEDKTGAAWLKTKQRVTLGFETTFRFQMSGGGDGCPGGADGFAFVVQHDSESALSEQTGDSIGYRGIPRSLAVEFDPYGRNVGEHTYGQHISVQTDGAAPNRASPAFSLGIVTAPFKLDDNQVHVARIRYVPGTLTVFLDGQAEAALTVPVELATTLGLDDGQAWIGFTAATGAWYQRHDILSWQFRPLVDPATPLPRRQGVSPEPPGWGRSLEEDEDDRDPASLRNALRFYKAFAEQKEVADPESRFVIGKAHWRVGQIQDWLKAPDEAAAAYLRAFEVWRTLVQQCPNVPEYRQELAVKSRRLADVYSGRGQHEKAIAALSEAIKLAPDDASSADRRERRHFLLLERARAYGRLRQWDKAVADLSKAIELDPKLAVFWNNRGFAYGELDQWDKAVDDYSKAIELNPKYAVPWNNRGAAYGKLGEWDKAVDDYSKAIELDPKLAVGWRHRGFAYGTLGEWDKAVDDYSKAIELDPKDAVDWSNRGRAYGTLGEWDKAVDDYSKAIELDPKYAVHWSNRGFAYGKLGQWDKAVDDCSKAIELHPQCSRCWSNRRFAYGKLGQWDKAISDATKAVELAPQESAPRVARGGLYAEQGKWRQAIQDFAQAAKLDPKSAYTPYRRALAHLGAGDRDGYRRACAAVLERFAKARDARTAASAAWTCVLVPDAAGDPARVVELAESAAGKDPANDFALYTLGAALYRAGRFKEAVERFTQAQAAWGKATTKPATSSPSQAYTWFFLAMTHHRLGQVAGAKKYLQKAVKRAEEQLQPAAGMSWSRRLTLQLLRREAESLIGSAGKPTPNRKEVTPPKRD